MGEVEAGLLGGAHAQPLAQLAGTADGVGDGDQGLDGLPPEVRVAAAEELHLLGGGQVAHLERREAVELRGVQAEGRAEGPAAVHGGDELHVVGDGEEAVLDRVEDAARRVEGGHERVAGALGAAVQLVEEDEEALVGGLAGLLEGLEDVGLHEVRDGRPALARAHLDGREEVGRLDDGAAVEEDEAHAELVADGAHEGGLPAALRAVEEDVQAALEEHLELPRDHRVEPDALEAEGGRARVGDADDAAVVALGLRDLLDAHHHGHARLDARVVGEHDLGGAEPVEVRRAEREGRVRVGVREEGRLPHLPHLHHVDVELGHDSVLSPSRPQPRSVRATSPVTMSPKARLATATSGSRTST